jgi:hypothetical protein
MGARRGIRKKKGADGEAADGGADGAASTSGQQARPGQQKAG